MPRGKHFWPRYKAKGRLLIAEAAKLGIRQEQLVDTLQAAGVQVSKTQMSRIFQGLNETTDHVADAIAGQLQKRTRQLFDVEERPVLAPANATPPPPVRKASDKSAAA